MITPGRTNEAAQPKTMECYRVSGYVNSILKEIGGLK